MCLCVLCTSVLQLCAHCSPVILSNATSKRAVNKTSQSYSLIVCFLYSLPSSTTGRLERKKVLGFNRSTNQQRASEPHRQGDCKAHFKIYICVQEQVDWCRRHVQAMCVCYIQWLQLQSILFTSCRMDHQSCAGVSVDIQRRG